MTDIVHQLRRLGVEERNYAWSIARDAADEIERLERIQVKYDNLCQVLNEMQQRLAEAERLLLKFHESGPAGITALIYEVPVFLGLEGYVEPITAKP